MDKTNEKDILLSRSISKLDSLKNKLLDEIKLLEEDKNKCKDELDNFKDDENGEITPELNNVYKKTVDYNQHIRYIDSEIMFFIEQLEKIETLINYNNVMGDFSKVEYAIKHFKRFDVQEIIGNFANVSKYSGVKCPVRSIELKDLEGSLYGIAGLFFNYEVKVKAGENPSKSKLIDSIHEITDRIDLPLFERITDFLHESKLSLDAKIDKLMEDAKSIRISQNNKRREVIEKKILNIEERINNCNNKINRIVEAINLYEEYQDKVNHSVLLRLSGDLSNLGVITKRELKILRHQKVEKEEVKEEVIEEKVEKKAELEPVKQTELDDVQYYLDPETRNIICFLGNDKDSIDIDINTHFGENSSKPIIYRELNDIFNKLVFDSNYIQTGGKPKYFTDDKVKAIQATPYKFGYKRFGVSKDQFRIHAIDRQSKLLQKLGYGSGHIIFFGAVGVNDDKEKSGAYERLGGRVVLELSDHGRPPKLKSSFDDIEHITRGYVPISFLSDEDKEKLRIGSFNGKDKNTGIDKAVEGFNYVLYDVLDEESKSRVHDYLNKYFMEQSQKMFDYINSYKEMKGNNFD